MNYSIIDLETIIFQYETFGITRECSGDEQIATIFTDSLE